MMINKIIDYIKTNRVSSVEVSDALGKIGVLDGVLPLNKHHFRVGKVKYIYTYNESNYELHKQIQEIEENSIVFVDTFNCNNRAVLGDIVSKYLLLYKKAAALIVNGNVRDAHNLYKENYPIWSRGITSLGCFNKECNLSEDLKTVIQKRKQKFEGSVLIADDSGCCIIEKENHSEEFLQKLEFIELQEDIWYYCIDTLKMNTFDTICKKSYLKDPSLLPNILYEKLNKKGF